MENEKGNFRSSVFGGFNRQDVANYIEKLSAERNRYKEESADLRDKADGLEDTVEQLKAQIEELENQAAELKAQLDEANAQVIKFKEPIIKAVDTFDEVTLALNEFKSAFEADAKSAADLSAAASDSITKLCEYVGSIPVSAGAVCAKIDAVIEKLQQQKNESEGV